MSKPVHELRLRDIRASIWANQSDGRTWFNVTITRRFEAHGRWKDTASFTRDDLPIVSKVAELAYAWIWNQVGSRESSERPKEVREP